MKSFKINNRVKLFLGKPNNKLKGNRFSNLKNPYNRVLAFASSALKLTLIVLITK